MKYAETIQYLFQQLPMFQRVGKLAFKKDLTNTLKLLAALGDPHQKFPSIHIAGTNGKGSTSHMIAAAFQAHGFRVGLYTSPHYKDFRERIKINGQFIPKRTVSHFVTKNQDVFQLVKPSFFEMTVALAFDYFARQKVDIAIVETGLGGRLDSTNVLDPMLSVITNIGFDHIDMLGNTLEDIAFEKAGIIKSKKPVVVGVTHRKTKNVFLKKAKETGSTTNFADKALQPVSSKQTKKYQYFSFLENSGDKEWKGKTDLMGPFQLENLRTALMSLIIFSKTYPEWKLVLSKILRSFQNIIESTYFIGRWQYIDNQPDVLCDSAHNQQGLEAILSEIKLMKYPHFHFVLGFSQGKDIHKMISLFPQNGSFYIAKPKVPRGLDEHLVLEVLVASQRIGKAYSSVKKALQAAKKIAKKEDLIFVGGSSFVVAEVI